MLLNIDPMLATKGERRPDSPFDNTVHAGIRRGEWKLITGHPGRPEAPGKTRSYNLRILILFIPVNTTISLYLVGQARAMQEWLAPPDWMKNDSIRIPQDPFANDTNKNILLFNLTADPLEEHDLSEELPEVVNQLLQRYHTFILPPYKNVSSLHINITSYNIFPYILFYAKCIMY